MLTHRRPDTHRFITLVASSCWSPVWRCSPPPAPGRTGPGVNGAVVDYIGHFQRLYDLAPADDCG